MAIIALSGRKQHGKDTAAYMIQELTKENPRLIYQAGAFVTEWRKVIFAGKLKQMASSILGVDVAYFEDENFKNSEMPIEWHKNSPIWSPLKELELSCEMFGHKDVQAMIKKDGWIKVGDSDTYRLDRWQKPTYRSFLQTLGTDVCRKMHPDFWVNATMVDYTSQMKHFQGRGIRRHDGRYEVPASPIYPAQYHGQIIDSHIFEWEEFGMPDWLMPDCRFPNEITAVEKRGGIVIRIIDPRKEIPANEHESETALDGWTFRYIIYNDGTKEELKFKLFQLLTRIRNSQDVPSHH